MTRKENQDAGAVEELTVELGGVWRVSTLSSHYVFDLDQMTVTRYPGPTAVSTVHDTPRRLATIVRCAVGSGGYWTMTPAVEGPLQLQELWSASTLITSIERMR
ncbi:hypothetical protein OH146_00130 [Salinibacterium sp. SYSU T00001]|uniref:hypothetical protein n=1 Tax=Homoserinimonas sedimenticola TaxID=2986805 RepID=UPI0022356CB8|nr:hypothetical protein [Salinibacterium sedimenticola]MCW4384177.1 hypothetical protein [Salinibacterium sedimenticola]